MRRLLTRAAPATPVAPVAPAQIQVVQEDVTAAAAVAATAARDSHMSKYIIGVVIILAAAFFGVWYYISLPRPLQDPFSTLSIKSEKFAEANTLHFSAKTPEDQAKTEAAYKAALLDADSSAEKSMVEFRIALTVEQQGRYVEAIQQLKMIAANTQYPAFTRAYAIQELGLMYYNYGSPEITKEVFSTPPYDAMQAESGAVSYRHVFEYASSIYPLAASESFIAYLYANDMMKLFNASTVRPLTPEEQTSYESAKLEVERRLASAERDIARLDKMAQERYYRSYALLRVAIVRGQLARMKLGTDEAAEAAFQKTIAITDYESGDAESAFPRLHYAFFLSKRYGAERATEIHDLLSAIYTTMDKRAYSPIMKYFEGERKSVYGAKADLAALAKIDPQFKVALINLGWIESDF